MSDTENNSSNTPTQSTVDPTSHVQPSNVQQVMGLEDKDLGKSVSRVTVAKGVMLENKFNYSVWYTSINKSFDYVDKGLRNYMNDQTNDEMNNIYEQAADMLLTKYVNEEVFSEFKEQGLFGKDIYKELVNQYGVLTSHDKVRLAIKLFEEATSLSVPVSKLIKNGQKLDLFLKSCESLEAEALQLLIRLNIGNHAFIEKYLNMDAPILNLKNVKECEERHPEFSQVKSQTISLITKEKLNDQEKSNLGGKTSSKALGSAAIWQTQCTRCFGLGHLANSCSSPFRTGFIPDLDLKLSSYKSKKRKQQFTKSTTNTEQVKNPVVDLLEPKNFVSDATNPWDSKKSKSTNNVRMINSVGKDKDKDPDPNFYFDTGASVSVVFDKNFLHNYVELDTPAKLSVADNRIVQVFGYGILSGYTMNGSKIEISHVGYCPSISKNLINPKDILNAESSIQFTKTKVVHSYFGDIGTYNDLPKVNIKFKEKLSECQNLTLHESLGHPSQEVMKFLVKELNVKLTDLELEDCEICSQTKLYDAYPKFSNATQVTQPLFLVSMDICGPFKASVNQEQYFIVFVDDFTKYKYVKLLYSRNAVEICQVITDFISDAETAFTSKGNYKVANLRTDNAAEFLSHSVQELLQSKNIRHQTTVPHCSHQNGAAERAIRTIKQISTAFLLKSKLPYSFWNYAVICAGFVVNLIPTRTGVNKIPYKSWYFKDFDYATLHPFGCLVYAHIPKVYRKSFEPNGVKSIFLGYATSKHAFTVLNLMNQTICFTSITKFYDQNFPAEKINPEQLTKIISEGKGITTTSSSCFQRVPESLSSSNPGPTHEDPICSQEVSEVDFSPGELNEQGVTTSPLLSPVPSITQIDSEYTPSTNIASDSTDSVVGEFDPIDLEWSMLDTITDYVSDSVEGGMMMIHTACQVSHVEISHEIKRGENKRAKVLVQSVAPRSENNMSNIYIKSGVNVIKLPTETGIPENYKEAINSEEKDNWKEAMSEEMSAHVLNGTFFEMELPKGKNALGCRWVFAKKPTSENAFRYKARLVCQGFNQRYGQDYFETFSPVIRTESVKILFAIAAITEKKMLQLDVVTAFLNGDLEEEIYMKLPEGYNSATNKVYKLCRSLYGLKQAPLCWYNKLTSVLEKNGYTRFESEFGLYKKETVYIGVYVDDLLIIGDTDKEINEAKEMLVKNFKMRDLGSPKRFLGMNICHDKSGIKVSLEDYITNVAKETGMSECNAVATPCDPSSLMQLIEESKETGQLCDATEYRSLVGKLIFISNYLRFDISFITNVLARSFNSPQIKHLKGAKRVLRYLCGTKSAGLHYKRNPEIEAYCDADWGSSTSDRKSITGFIIKMGGAPISWKSKKQVSVALSTCEAEYMAIADIVKDLLWILQILENTEVEIQLPIIINEDNKSAILLSSHPTDHPRTKHISIRYHFIRQKLNEKIICLQHTSSKEMIADVLTKALTRTQFEYLIKKGGLTKNLKSNN